MYKIMTKLHTQTENVYRYYMIRNGQGKLVEFETEDREEAAEVALELLRQVGYLDLRVVNEEPYYIDVEKTDDPGVSDDDILNAERLLGCVGYDDLYLNHDAKYDVIWNWGTRPEPETPTYTLTFVGDEQGHWSYAQILNIKEGETRVNTLTIEGAYESFHLIVDGYDCKDGMPNWIKYMGGHVFQFLDIKADHEIEIVVDGSPEPPVDTFTLTFKDGDGCMWATSEIINIPAGESRHNSINIEGEYDTFYLTIDGIDYTKALPEWVIQDGTAYTFNNINADHLIDITVIRPIPPVETYTLTFIDAAKGHWALPVIDNLQPGDRANNEFTVDGEYETTHLIIDDIEYLVLPEWVELHDNTYIFNNIAANHTIQLVVVIGPGPEPKPFDDLVQDGTYLIGFNQNPILPSDIMELLNTTDAVHQFDYDEKSGRELMTIFGVCTMDNRPIIGYMKESVNSRNKVKNYFTIVNQETLAVYNKDVTTPLEYTHDGWIEAWYEIDENTGAIVNG